MIVIQDSKYLDLLSKFGVGGAHPGGLNLTKKLFKSENINNTSKILDVGCGTGQTAAFLAHEYGATVTGIDVNSTMVAKAKERMKKNRLPVNIIHGSIEQTSLPNHHFDYIISESVLSFVNKPKALDEIFRLLKSGGRFIAIELTIINRLTEKEEHEIKQFYGLDSLNTKNDWVTLLSQAGFEQICILKNTYIDSDPEFHMSDDIDPKLHEIMEKHFDLVSKYLASSYRIYSCTKK